MKLDQHFLKDKKIAEFLVNSASLKKTESVLEIGPGKGALTDFIIKKTSKLTLIEQDEELASSLKRYKADVIQGNALENLVKFDKLVSSLPYSICEPLLWKLTRLNFKLAVLLVPKKFYLKLIGEQESKLSLLTPEFFKIEFLKDVKPSSFSPEPKIDSCIIRLTPNQNSTLLKEVFLQRDKKIKNALENILTKRGKTKRQVKEILNIFDKKMLNEVISHLSLIHLKELKEFLETI